MTIFDIGDIVRVDGEDGNFIVADILDYNRVDEMGIIENVYLELVKVNPVANKEITLLVSSDKASITSKVGSEYYEILINTIKANRKSLGVDLDDFYLNINKAGKETPTVDTGDVKNKGKSLNIKLETIANGKVKFNKSEFDTMMNSDKTNKDIESLLKDMDELLELYHKGVNNIEEVSNERMEELLDELSHIRQELVELEYFKMHKPTQRIR